MNTLKNFIASLLGVLVPAGQIRFDIVVKNNTIDARPNYDGEYNAVRAAQEIRNKKSSYVVLPIANFLAGQFDWSYVFHGPTVIEIARQTCRSSINSKVLMLDQQDAYAAARIIKFAADQKNLDHGEIDQIHVKIDHRMYSIAIYQNRGYTTDDECEFVTFNDVRELANDVILQFPSYTWDANVTSIVNSHIDGWDESQNVLHQLHVKSVVLKNTVYNPRYN